ncbi:MAG: putative zinc-binding metallopeptidase [Rhizobiaceae bacterium]
MIHAAAPIRPAHFFVRLILMFFLIWSFSCKWAYSGEQEINSVIRAIHSDFDVDVYHQYDPASYFPESWRAAPISAIGNQLSTTEIKRTLPIIREFLTAYPEPVIRDNLDSVYLLSRLNFFGKSYGGTNSKKSIYIKSEGIEKGFSDSYLLGLMHHEFSSILMRNYPFPMQEWNKLNPKKFRYLGDGKSALDWKNPHLQNKNLLRDGFLIKYSTSSTENDFNVMSSWLFTHPQELKKIASRYPKINSKLNLTLEFLRSIDGDFAFN